MDWGMSYVPAGGSYNPAGSIYISDLPPESDQGDFWARIISTLAGAGIAAYQISQGQPVSTTTTQQGSVIQSGQSAYQPQFNTLIIVGVIVLLAVMFWKK